MFFITIFGFNIFVKKDETFLLTHSSLANGGVFGKMGGLDNNDQNFRI